jgi:hypothetical protein
MSKMHLLFPCSVRERFLLCSVFGQCKLDMHLHMRALPQNHAFCLTLCTGCLSSPKRYYQLGWQMKPVFYRRLAGKSCWMALGQYEHIDNQAGDAMDLWPDFV